MNFDQAPNHRVGADELPLSARERKTLELYLQFRERPPSVWHLLLRFIPYWSIGGILLAAVIGVLATVDQTVAMWLALFVVGFLVGLIGRDIRYSWTIARNFPLIARVIDWTKVERLCS